MAAVKISIQLTAEEVASATAAKNAVPELAAMTNAELLELLAIAGFEGDGGIKGLVREWEIRAMRTEANAARRAQSEAFEAVWPTRAEPEIEESV